MINHVRTLLLNVDGSKKPGYNYPGEEYVPDDYRAKSLPAPLQLVRSILFSRDPDRLLLNYRLSQYMHLLHSSPLEEDVLAFDSRVTYLPATNKIFDAYRIPYSIGQVVGSTKNLSLLGDPYAATDRDKLYHQWYITVLDSDTVSIRKIAPIASTSSVEYTTSGGLSSVVQLPASNLAFQFETGNTPEWMMTLLHKPAEDLGVILSNLSIVDSDDITRYLFIQSHKLDSVTNNNRHRWRDIWLNHDELAYRLGAVLLAFVSAYELI